MRKIIASDGRGKLVVERYPKGPYLYTEGGFMQLKLTPVRARKMVAALMPFTEWTPEQNGYRPTGKSK